MAGKRQALARKMASRNAKSAAKKAAQYRTAVRFAAGKRQGIQGKRQGTLGTPVKLVKAAVAAKIAPTVKPFLSAEDMLLQSEKQGNWNSELGQLGGQLSQQAIDADYQRQNIAKARDRNIGQATDDAVSRGLFRSSIRDNNLADISADAAIKRTNVDTSLRAAQNQYNSRVNQIGAQERPALQSALASRAVQNAVPLNANRRVIAPARAAQYQTIRPAATPAAKPLGPRAVTPTTTRQVTTRNVNKAESVAARNRRLQQKYLQSRRRR